MNSVKEILDRLLEEFSEYPDDFTEWETSFLRSVDKKVSDADGSTKVLSSKQLDVIIKLAKSKGIES